MLPKSYSDNSCVYEFVDLKAGCNGVVGSGLIFDFFLHRVCSIKYTLVRDGAVVADAPSLVLAFPDPDVEWVISSNSGKRERESGAAAENSSFI